MFSSSSSSSSMFLESDWLSAAFGQFPLSSEPSDHLSWRHLFMSAIGFRRGRVERSETQSFLTPLMRSICMGSHPTLVGFDVICCSLLAPSPSFYSPPPVHFHSPGHVIECEMVCKVGQPKRSVEWKLEYLRSPFPSLLKLSSSPPPASAFPFLVLSDEEEPATLEPPARMGRGKIEIKRIENTTNRQVTFCKRRNGLLKKAYELSVLCDADVALIVFSTRGRLYEYATNSVKATIDRYKKACNGTTNTGFASEDNAQYYQQEASKLRQQINNLQSTNRSLMGESLGSMSLRDMKQLETRLEKGINKIRNKKNELLFAEIEYMQKREMELQNDNMYLRNKIAENERAQQQMSMLPSTRTTEYEIMPQYDSRNFLQVNAVQPTQHYTHQQRTALQLG
ncbi:hypothetical protein OPV22_023376 [Ensete ventricosum]|uniref:MADS-box domain-containing protein n=1 Tax=Ensete ventricosum TaxID=4639 RepID=A0AAV8QWL2_ENSVE|nr:hypothetical protein OPV22_023376 [Ensete ventricosum]